MIEFRQFNQWDASDSRRSFYLAVLFGVLSAFVRIVVVSSRLYPFVL
jgi:hypothetical protein